MQRRLALQLAGSLPVASAWGQHGPRAPGLPVRVPGPPYPVGALRFFQGELLELALRKGGSEQGIELLSTQTWPRQVRELRDGHADVAPLPALDHVYAEFKLARVDFPLRRGLLGLRRLVCRADRLPQLDSVRSLSELQALRLGYGAEWADLPILQRLGFRIVTARSTEQLYAGLRNGEIDYLSRGVNELHAEMSRFGPAGAPLALLPGLALFYPLDDCFFVAPGRTELHRTLTEGLARALRDGSYAALFEQHYSKALDDLAGVRVLELKGYPTPRGLSRQRFDVLKLRKASA